MKLQKLLIHTLIKVDSVCVDPGGGRGFVCVTVLKVPLCPPEHVASRQGDYGGVGVEEDGRGGWARVK